MKFFSSLVASGRWRGMLEGGRDDCQACSMADVRRICIYLISWSEGDSNENNKKTERNIPAHITHAVKMAND